LTARILWKIVPLIILIWAFYANANRFMTLYYSLRKAVYVQMTESEIKVIGKAITAEYQYSNKLPESDSFTKWMKNRIDQSKKRKRAVGTDYFGQYYLFSRGFNDEFTITSRGPDKKLNTRDDIKVKFSAKMGTDDTSPSR